MLIVLLHVVLFFAVATVVLAFAWSAWPALAVGWAIGLYVDKQLGGFVAIVGGGACLWGAENGKGWAEPTGGRLAIWALAPLLAFPVLGARSWRRRMADGRQRAAKAAELRVALLEAAKEREGAADARWAAGRPTIIDRAANVEAHVFGGDRRRWMERRRAFADAPRPSKARTRWNAIDTGLSWAHKGLGRIARDRPESASREPTARQDDCD